MYGKKTVGIVCKPKKRAVTTKNLLERTLEGFRGFTACLSGAKEKGVIYGTGAWNIGDIKRSSAMTRAYETGKNV